MEAFFVEIGHDVYEGQLLARVANRANEAEREAAQRALDATQTRVNDIESALIAARLEASRARAEASRARTDYDRLDRSHKRHEMLYREGATPRLALEKVARDFEAVQAEYKSLDAAAAVAEERVGRVLKELDAAKAVLDERNAALEEVKERAGLESLLSPADGVISARKGQVGEEVTLETKDFIQIATRLSELEVALEPEPPVLAMLAAGQDALVIVADLAGDGIPGKVVRVAASEAVVEFISPSAAVRPGSTATVRIRTK
ncbi:MAG: hypothetical protein ACRD96_28295 [Bryobacteraceae bacterium]